MGIDNLRSADDDGVIPFMDIILPYTKNLFCLVGELQLEENVKRKLKNNILEELSSISEVTLQTELDRFIKGGNRNFEEFIQKLKLSLDVCYPVLDVTLKRKVSNFSNNILKILSRFNSDLQNIVDTFRLNKEAKSIKIIDICLNIGDGHNGEGTTLVYLSGGTKLIYKPRNVEITHSYNSFIEWINLKTNFDLKIFNVLDCGGYGWLEFIEYKEFNCKSDLQKYYYKAGMLLAITLLIGSKDFHSENVITSGAGPLLIDHETIVQPVLKYLSDKDKMRTYTVLESLLITNLDEESIYPPGYGVRGSVSVLQTRKKILNPNTLNSRRISCLHNVNIVEKNVPTWNGDFVFVNEYKDYFSDGFSSMYDFFFQSKNELKSYYSPLNVFRDKEVRFILRPTFVYVNILNYLRNSYFMSSFEVYKDKLYELLSKAYKPKHMQQYKFVVNIEMEQMINGDIPLFDLNSLGKSLKGNNTLDIFEHNAIDNIFHRVDILSQEHKMEQLAHITKWSDI